MVEEDRKCRILILQPFTNIQSSSVSNNAELARVQGLISAIKQDQQDDTTTHLNSSPANIPWNISNRYYEANVHFKISTVNVLGSASKSARPSKARRGVKMMAEHGTEETGRDLPAATIATSDKELQDSVRDVFQALEASERLRPKAGPSRVDEEKIEALQREVEGIDAVMMVINRDEPFREHERLLSLLNSVKDDKALLSGFDLAISLVVALPSPLQLDSSDSKALPSFSTELNQLYTSEGWEFIDLEENSGVENLNEEHDNYDLEESMGEGERDDYEEAQGIDRIREALETHTWPGLSRKNDRLSTLRSGGNDIQDAPSSSVTLDELTIDDEIAQRALDSLQLDLGSVDADGSAEPTKQDEELAQAFLKKILASQIVSEELPNDELEKGEPPRSLHSMQQELERFLESQDTAWPRKPDKAVLTNEPVVGGKEEKEEDDDAWETSYDATTSNSKAAFDDHFSDFVSGQQGDSFDRQENQPHSPNDLDLDLDLDDIALIEGLAGEEVGGGSKMRNPIDFESTLSVVMAQAERVRSISDRDKRREEAARIALALVREQPRS